MSSDSPYVTLISSDQFRFILPRSAALGSVFLSDTLSSGFLEAGSSTITLGEHRAEIVEKVVEYLLFKDRYSSTKEEVPDFKERVRPEIALELLMASDFMGC